MKMVPIREQEAKKHARELLQGLAGVDIKTCEGTKLDDERIVLNCMIRAGPKGEKLAPLTIKAKANETTELEVSVHGITLISKKPDGSDF